MRLWHKDLIDVLPRQQLIAQWRECCCITKNIADNGHPNHILVNKIMDFSLEQDFFTYCELVTGKMLARGYKVSDISYEKFARNLCKACKNRTFIADPHYEIFKGWHDNRYLKQCLYNLQEKYDCGGISEEEWNLIENKFGDLL